jgi:hypothetical protein
MTDTRSIQFGFSAITTDEFALTGEVYDPAIEAQMNVTVDFSFIKNESRLKVGVKCLLYQEEKTLVIIAVSCWFKVSLDDWYAQYNEEGNTLTLQRLAALHFAGLTVSTTRGALHAKTENRMMQSVVLPPVNLNEIIKEDIILILQPLDVAGA